jgi:hypothetical protein
MASDSTTLPENLFHREHVLPHFWHLWEALAPACHLCGSGGSLRRRTPLVKDIEIICLPFYDPIAPLKPVRTYSALSDALQLLLDGRVLLWDEANKKRGDLYKRFVLPALAATDDSPGIGVDLFLSDYENRGYIQMLRTGGADFSHAMVTRQAKGGLRPEEIRCKDGYVWRAEADASGTATLVKLPMRTEERLFGAWGLPYVPAVDRTPEMVHELRRGLGLPYIPLLRMESTPRPAEPYTRMEAFA